MSTRGLGTPGDIRTGIRHGLAWSSVSSIVLRFGTLAVGIFLARMLSPAEFGVFAVVLTVQTVLMTLADLGLSTDLIRSPDHERKAPTVATLSLVMSAALTVALFLGSGTLSRLLGAPEAAPVLAVMSLTLVIAGVGVIPYAALQRDFLQKRVFLISVVDFVVGTAVTVALILAGWGVMALAVARVAAQASAVVLQFVLTRRRLRLGFDRKLARGVLAFGIPLAAANLLSWALLGIDKMVLSTLAGTTVLGFYYLAFNVANWPMSVFGQIVRSVSLPAFSRLANDRRDTSLAVAMAPVWTGSGQAGLMLAMLSGPLVGLLYGDRWSPAATLLSVLAVFGALRTLVDLSTAYLLARGKSDWTLWLQVGWMVALVPLLVLGVRTADGFGAALAQVVASVVLVVLFGWVLRRAGVDLRATWSSVWPPLLAAIPAGLVVWGLKALVEPPLAALLAGGLLGSLAYAAVLWRWFRPRLAAARELGSGSPVVQLPPADHLSSDQLASTKESA